MSSRATVRRFLRTGVESLPELAEGTCYLTSEGCAVNYPLITTHYPLLFPFRDDYYQLR